jgi:hypothetical protein
LSPPFADPIENVPAGILTHASVAGFIRRASCANNTSDVSDNARVTVRIFITDADRKIT